MSKVFYCNKCGKKMDEFDIQQEFSVSSRLCYGSKYDTAKLDIDLCCSCMDDLIESCKISPVEEDDYGF